MEDDMGDDNQALWTKYQKLQQGAVEAYEQASRTGIELAERYSAESFAASGSDDPMTKSYLAWIHYQRDLADVAQEYWRSIAAYRRAASTLSLDAEEAATTSTFRQYRERVDQLVSDMETRDRGKKSVKPEPQTRTAESAPAARRAARSRSTSKAG
jgi:hypothetical protein